MVNENEKLSNKQKKCMIKIINDFYNIYICFVHKNIIFCIGYTELNYIYHCIYIINDEYFIKQYLEYSEPAPNAIYTFWTNDDELLFNIIYLRIIKYSTNKLCEDILIKYSEYENILLLFTIFHCVNIKMCKTIKTNIINELKAANIIIDGDTKDKIFKLLSNNFIKCNIDDILNSIFGFIPKTRIFID